MVVGYFEKTKVALPRFLRAGTLYHRTDSACRVLLSIRNGFRGRSPHYSSKARVLQVLFMISRCSGVKSTNANAQRWPERLRTTAPTRTGLLVTGTENSRRTGA